MFYFIILFILKIYHDFNRIKQNEIILSTRQIKNYDDKKNIIFCFVDKLEKNHIKIENFEDLIIDKKILLRSNDTK